MESRAGESLWLAKGMVDTQAYLYHQVEEHYRLTDCELLLDNVGN
jgi:hypothetical protein